jgi:hypothetical protein
MGGGFKQLTRCGWLLVAVLMAAAADTRAQTVATATGTFVVAAQSRLTILPPTTLTFLNADPDTVPNIQASEGATAMTASVRIPSGQGILTVLADDDLRSGMDTILVSALKWTATGTGYVGGTMSKSVAQTVATWNTSGSYTGTVTFTLSNSWIYAIGSYGTTLTYTLSTP